MSVKDLWQCAAHADGPANQWASIWMSPGSYPFTVAEVVERLNETLGALGSDFKFEPDPLLSNDHYAWCRMRDHLQAYAITLLGRIVTQILLDEKQGIDLSMKEKRNVEG